MKHLARLFIGVLAVGITFTIIASVESFGAIFAYVGLEDNAINVMVLQLSVSIFIGLIFYFISPWIFTKITSASRLLLRSTGRIPAPVMAIGSTGAVIGLILGSLFSLALGNIPLVGPYLALITTLMFIYFGWQLSMGRSEEILRFMAQMRRPRAATPLEALAAGIPSPEDAPERVVIGAVRKILDTSVIIDGRILDLCSTGFLEGPLLIPVFVLEELRALADSGDDQKRMRGRRGLDILNQIQQEGMIDVQIVEIDYPDLAVDDKLLKLTQQVNGKLLTLDFNLSKVCQLRKVSVLNINELANALRSVLLPGEALEVTVTRIGREAGQGVAYLDDGTMMVIEGGSKLVGRKVQVVVTSSLQTAAGRMIFAKTA